MKTLLSLLLLFSTLLGQLEEFGYALYDEVKEENKNTLFSPYSIISTLSMVYEGARGATALSMKKALYLPDGPLAPGYGSVSNLFFAPDIKLLPSFRKELKNQFNVAPESLDFSDPAKAVEAINSWAAKKTLGTIPSVMTPSDLSSSTKLVLISTLYLTSKWDHPFNPKDTKKEPFHYDGGEEAPVPMMEQTALFPFASNERYQAAQFPLENKLALLVILPTKSLTFDLALQEEVLRALKPEKVHVKLPKFSLLEKLDLQSPLTELGMGSAFTDEADFSGIDGKRDLYLSKVLHEAFIRIDEAGLTASAATSAAMNLTATGGKPLEFIVNRPFFFLLLDTQNQTPIFIGELRVPYE